LPSFGSLQTKRRSVCPPGCEDLLKLKRGGKNNPELGEVAKPVPDIVNACALPKGQGKKWRAAVKGCPLARG